jgi:hypothetical protein
MMRTQLCGPICLFKTVGVFFFSTAIFFYVSNFIRKLTAFLQLQEFSQRNLTVASSTSAARLSLPSSKAKLDWLSLRQQPGGLILT